MSSAERPSIEQSKQSNRPGATFPLPDRHALSQLWDELRKRDRLPAVDKWLDDTFKRNKKFGKRDRQQIRNAIFTVFRYGEAIVLAEENVIGTSFDLAAKTQSSNETANDKEASLFHMSSPRSVLPRLFALSWKEVVRRFHSIQSTRAHSRPSVDQATFALSSDSKSIATDEAIALCLIANGIPQAYTRALRQRITRSGWNADQIRAFIEMQSEPAPLWLRANLMRCTAESLQQELSEHSDSTVFTQAPTQTQPFSADRLHIRTSKNLYETAAFKGGLFEIQDFASQEIGRHAFAHSDDSTPTQPRFIWDACAGAGGKSLQMATHLANRGAVYCTDIRAHALRELQRRARRHGLTNIRCQLWDGKQIPPLPKAVARNGGFDLVFIDAPCSSSGTWRRNPEARYRLDESTLKSFQEVQLGLLHTAARAVAPGGRLVYATCSWLTAENEDVIEQFIKETAHNDPFELESSQLHGCPNADADCMYSARLKRAHS